MNEDQGKTMTLRELADAVERGDKIEVEVKGIWELWTESKWDYNWRYRIVKPEPKLVPHWPALLLARDGDGGVYTSSKVHPDEESAKKQYSNFIRLVDEYPAIMREVKE